MTYHTIKIYTIQRHAYDDMRVYEDFKMNFAEAMKIFLNLQLKLTFSYSDWGPSIKYHAYTSFLDIPLFLAKL